MSGDERYGSRSPVARRDSYKAADASPARSWRSRSASRSRSRSRSRSASRSPVPKRRGRSRSPSHTPPRKRRRSYSRSYSRSRSRSNSRSRHRRRYSRSRSRSYSPYARRGGGGGRYGGGRRRGSRSPLSNRKRHQGNRFNPPPGRVVGVFGLTLYTGEKDLKDLFSKYGPIEQVKVIYDHQTGRSRGFAFIYYEDTEDAIDAKEHCNGLELDGRKIRVDYSITKRAHTPTPGVYMGKPTKSSYDERDRDRDRDRGRHDDRDDYYDRGDRRSHHH